MESLQAKNPPFDFNALDTPMTLYPQSVRQTGDGWVFMAQAPAEDWLFACGQAAAQFEGKPFENGGQRWVQAPLGPANAGALRALFPFTAPVPVLKNPRTIGLGDRLGLAAPGHLAAVEAYDALPVLAQQSIRELTLTGRGYCDVLDAASFGVFRAGFTRGFGADGDHLKKTEEIEYALGLGFTMITLDCSEHIRPATAQPQGALPGDLIERYVGKTFPLEGGLTISISLEELRQCHHIYGDAIRFASNVYTSHIAGRAGGVDFEISIDETDTPTLPCQHFFVANELIRHGVHFETMAPRFCGEFQKGVDYIGDVARFEAELECHAAIARHFGYKLSIHSGSDKFSVFEAIGRQTHGCFHLKTAGTSWLEAMRLVAQKAPGLYREVHQFALEHFEEARRYYHVTTNLDNIPGLNTLADSDLPALLNQNDARQLLHITYGLILCQTLPGGGTRFKNRLYALWRQQATAYAELLEKHIGRHLALLYAFSCPAVPTEPA